MTPGRVARAVRGGVLSAVLVAVAVPITVPTAAAAATAPSVGAVQIRVTDVTPTAPARSESPTPLQIRLTLTNTTSDTLSKVSVAAFRGNPVGSQRELDSVIGDTTPPTDGLAIAAAKPVTVQLPPRSSVATVFTSSISVLNEGGVCQCINAVYPLHLTATTGGTLLGSATTFVPSQVESTVKTKVGWVWPFIDRPHRLTDETVFSDDDLAASVSGGRLDRVLQVVEQLDADIPMTLLVDPELLDELEVMATGSYTVQTSDGTVPGTGQTAARTWLARFVAVLASHPESHVSLTPYADPDVRSLAGKNQSWDSSLPSSMASRVALALGSRPTVSDVAAPPGGALPSKALNTIAAAGARTVVVDSTALRPSTRSGIPTSLARLRTSEGTVTAVGAAPAMQRQVADAVTSEALSATTGSTVLPYLVAETAVRSVQSGNAPSYAVLMPPRYVDPDPDRAVRAIETTSSNPYATPVDIRDLASERNVKTVKLRSNAASAGNGLPVRNLAAHAAAAASLPTISAMLERNQNARVVVAGIGAGNQRVVSAAWRPLATSPFASSLGPEFASTLRDRVMTILGGVRIITPSSGSGSYTLGSQDSSLPITVENTLPYPVSVAVTVATPDRLRGYEMGDLGIQRIAANSKQTVQVPSKVERSGRIPVVARLSAPTGRTLGEPVSLFVRSTFFGTIGVVITFVAGGVLVIALLVRFGRRLTRLRRQAAKTDATTVSGA